MENEGYIVVYDILRDGIGIVPIGAGLGSLVGFFVGVGALVWRRKLKIPVGFLIIWFLIWTTISIIGGRNVISQHLRCVACVQSGGFEVVEGRVTHFQPRAWWEKGSESFTVNGITFSYNDAVLSRGGFRYRFGPDGLLQEGVQVRVSYKEERILIFEIQQD